ncbi:hypothetical protein [Geobacillus thermoleovorans]|uniref:hypothetical protein n=1 Tax=Geobacillus thermoleovorans TaxID=33941 RepID=UPI0008460042|nr:hypothetical protein [Geobacillus thermoleovorans]AOL34226.1 hypothetical protein BGM21_06695 [Geobacillus thermoleovorans]
MFSIHEELERLSQKYRFFASKEAFKQSLKFQLQEKFRVEENKRFHDYLIDLWVEEPESGRQYAICLTHISHPNKVKTKDFLFSFSE